MLQHQNPKSDHLIHQYLKEVSRVPAAFSARRFTGSDDGVWGGLPEKPLCRAQVVRM